MEALRRGAGQGTSSSAAAGEGALAVDGAGEGATSTTGLKSKTEAEEGDGGRNEGVVGGERLGRLGLLLLGDALLVGRHDAAPSAVEVKQRSRHVQREGEQVVEVHRALLLLLVVLVLLGLLLVAPLLADLLLPFSLLLLADLRLLHLPARWRSGLPLRHLVLVADASEQQSPLLPAQPHIRRRNAAPLIREQT